MADQFFDPNFGNTANASSSRDQFQMDQMAFGHLDNTNGTTVSADQQMSILDPNMDSMPTFQSIDSATLFANMDSTSIDLTSSFDNMDSTGFGSNTSFPNMDSITEYANTDSIPSFSNMDTSSAYANIDSTTAFSGMDSNMTLQTPPSAGQTHSTDNLTGISPTANPQAIANYNANTQFPTPEADSRNLQGLQDFDLQDMNETSLSQQVQMLNQNLGDQMGYQSMGTHNMGYQSMGTHNMGFQSLNNQMGFRNMRNPQMGYQIPNMNLQSMDLQGTGFQKLGNQSLSNADMGSANMGNANMDNSNSVNSTMTTPSNVLKQLADPNMDSTIHYPTPKSSLLAQNMSGAASNANPRMPMANMGPSSVHETPTPAGRTIASQETAATPAKVTHKKVTPTKSMPRKAIPMQRGLNKAKAQSPKERNFTQVAFDAARQNIGQSATPAAATPTRIRMPQYITPAPRFTSSTWLAAAADMPRTEVPETMKFVCENNDPTKLKSDPTKDDPASLNAALEHFGRNVLPKVMNTQKTASENANGHQNMNGQDATDQSMSDQNVMDQNMTGQDLNGQNGNVQQNFNSQAMNDQRTEEGSTGVISSACGVPTSSTAYEPAQTAQVTAQPPDSPVVNPSGSTSESPHGDQSHVWRDYNKLMAAQNKHSQAVFPKDRVSPATSDSQVFSNQQSAANSSASASGQASIDLTTGTYKPAQVVTSAKINAQAVHHNQQQPSGFSPTGATGPASHIDLTSPSPRKLVIPQPQVQAALDKAKALENGTYRPPVNGRAVARPQTTRKSPALKANPLAVQNPPKVTKTKARKATKVSNAPKSPKAPKVTKAAKAKAARLAEALPTHVPDLLNDNESQSVPADTNAQDLQQDAYLSQPVEPANFVQSLHPPKPPSAKDMLEGEKVVGWEIQQARHLAAIGIKGPYVIGSFLCEVQQQTGQVVKLAKRCFNTAKHEWAWLSLFSGGVVQTNSDNISGQPLSLSDGSFQGLTNDQGLIQPPVQFVGPDREANISPEAEEQPVWNDYPNWEFQELLALQDAV
ncbi:Fc.00g004380.m01.CDS01 [Cosmosporella sp. VM-42]